MGPLFIFQLLSHVWLFATPSTAACQASLSSTISQSLLKLMSIESMIPSNHFNLCYLFSLYFPSIRVFSNESALHFRWPKYWSLSISFPVNIQGWFHLGLTGLISSQSKGLSRVLQQHSSKPSILWCSTFFTVQFSHPYMTTGKTIAFTILTFVGKVMSLLFNLLRFFQ